MSTNTSVFPKAFPIRRLLVIGLIVILGIAVTAGFVWMQTDHVIAPPYLRLLDGLWRIFIYRRPILGDPLLVM